MGHNEVMRFAVALEKIVFVFTLVIAVIILVSGVDDIAGCCFALCAGVMLCLLKINSLTKRIEKLEEEKE